MRNLSRGSKDWRNLQKERDLIIYEFDVKAKDFRLSWVLQINLLAEKLLSYLIYVSNPVSKLS